MKYLKLMVITLICALSYGVFSASAIAHGDGVTHSMESGEYLIEFEYTADGEIVAGTPYPFAVYLLDHETKEPRPFTYLEVKLASKDGTALLAKFSPPLDAVGTAEFITILPEAGVYTAILDFSDGKNTIASGQTTFKVIGPQSEPVETAPIQGGRGWGIVAVAAVLGIHIGLLIQRKKN